MREDFGVIQAATLTLLGLIIGFTSADTEFKFSTPNPPGIPSPNKIETRFGTLAFEFTPTPSLPRRSDGKFIGDF